LTPDIDLEIYDTPKQKDIQIEYRPVRKNTQDTRQKIRKRLKIECLPCCPQSPPGPASRLKARAMPAEPGPIARSPLRLRNRHLVLPIPNDSTTVLSSHDGARLWLPAIPNPVAGCALGGGGRDSVAAFVNSGRAGVFGELSALECHISLVESLVLRMDAGNMALPIELRLLREMCLLVSLLRARPRQRRREWPRRKRIRNAC
jgi:hypothetical protein